MYYNTKSYGMPYYLTSPKTKSIRKSVNVNKNDSK